MPSKPTAEHLLIVLALTSPAGAVAADDYYVYFLGGQSNMVGYGTVSELTDEQRTPPEGARLYNGKEHEDLTEPTGFGLWTDVEPGHGFEWDVDESGVTLSPRFGSELSFARTIRSLRPDEKVALIKYARGATSIDVRASWWGTWDPSDDRGEGELKGINQLDHAVTTIERAMAAGDIDGDGEPDRLIPAGILWMQGESDASRADTAAVYEENLHEVIAVLRGALEQAGDPANRDRPLPVVIARISDKDVQNGSGGIWKFGNEIRSAQHAFVHNDANAAILTETDAFGYSDPAHYDTQGFLDLGVSFAREMHTLRGDEGG